MLLVSDLRDTPGDDGNDGNENVNRAHGGSFVIGAGSTRGNSVVERYAHEQHSNDDEHDENDDDDDDDARSDVESGDGDVDEAEDVPRPIRGGSVVIHEDGNENANALPQRRGTRGMSIVLPSVASGDVGGDTRGAVMHIVAEEAQAEAEAVADEDSKDDEKDKEMDDTDDTDG